MNCGGFYLGRGTPAVRPAAKKRRKHSVVSDIVTNRKARRDYHILETLSALIWLDLVLVGARRE